MEKTFTDCLKPIIGGCGMPPNFTEKTFADGSQTSKSAKDFSFERFLLYSNFAACSVCKPVSSHRPTN